jgi:hypothetical protein
MKNNLLLLITLCFIGLVQSQPLEYRWHRGDNLCGFGTVKGIEMTATNDLITLVSLSGQIDADPSVEDTLISGTHAIIKYDDQRRFLWVVSWSNNAFSLKMKTDHAGNIYCYSDFNGSLDADPGPGVSTITASNTSSFVVKLSPEGVFQWVKVFSSTNSIYITSLVFDDQDNLYLGGYYNGTVDADPAAPVQNLSLTSGSNAYMIKLKLNGDYVRSMAFGNGIAPPGCFLELRNDNLFFSSRTYGLMDIDPSTNVVQIGSANLNTAFVAKYDTTFNYQSVATFLMNDPAKIAINDDGDLILSGIFNSSFDSNPTAATNTLTTNLGAISGFVIELDHQFNFYHSFTIPFGGSGFAVEEVDVHENGYYTLLGTFKGTYDFDPIGTYTLTSVSGSENDIFVAQYNPGGILISAHKISNSYLKSADDLLVTAGKKVFVGGGIRGTTDIDPSSSFVDPELSGTSRKPILIEYTAGSNIYVNLFDTICKGETYSLGDLTLVESGIYTYSFPLLSGLDSIVELHLTVNQPNLSVEMVNGTLVCSDTNANSYQWYNCGTQSIEVGTNGFSFTPIDNSPYAVVVERNNCFDTSLCQQFTQFSNLGVPDLDWADKISNSLWLSQSVITDQYDNFYVAGTYTGVSDVELFGGNTEIYQSPNSGDLMLMKYNNDGILQWVYTAGMQGTSAISERVDAMAVDKEGNVYFTGRYENSLDFDPNEYNTAILNDMSPSSCCSYSIFFAKLNPNGQLLWVKSVGAPGNDMRPYDMAIDSRGNIAIGGEMESILTDFDPGVGVVNVSGGGFVARYDRDGNFLSVLPIPNSGSSFSPVKAIDFGPSDELVIAGRLTGSGDFDPGPGTLNLSGTTSTSYTFFASYDSLFNLNWAKKFSPGSSTFSYYFGMDIDHQGQIYLCTNTVGFTDFSGGLNTPGQSISTNGLYLVRFNSGGSMVYRYGFSAPADPVSLDLDVSGNIYVIGRKYSTSSITLTSTNSIPFTASSTYVAKYLNSGLQAYGFVILDEELLTHFPDIAADSKGNFFIVSDGHANNSFDVDPSGNNYLLTTSSGYVAKYGHSCSPINTAHTVSGITATAAASGAHYTFKRCADHSIVASGFNPTFTACEENDFYCVIEMGICIDSTSCFYLNPNPTVSISAPSLQICPNESITFSSTINQLCAPAYQWMVNGLPVTGETNTTFTGFGLQDNDQVYCEIIGNNFTDTMQTNILTVDLLTLPNTNVVLSGDSLATVQPGGTYSWNNCGNNNVVQSSGDNTFMACEEGDYYVVIDMGSCLDSSDCFHLIPDPSAAVISSDLQVCQNESVYFETYIQQICDPEYQWYVNGVALTGENASSLTINTLVDNDQVYCVLSFNNGTQNLQTNTVSVDIFSIPIATITLSGMVLSANPSSSTYTWINCATLLPVSGEISQSFTPAVNGTYASIVTNADGCSDTSGCFVYELIGLDALNISDIEIHPNPTDGMLNVHANFDLSTSKISLCNTFGKKIEISPNISGPTVTVAISHLSSGIYFLEVDTASEKYIFRIVKT